MKNVEEKQNVTNGFNINQLGRLMENLKENPETGNVTFQCKTRWQDGARAFHYFSGYNIDGTTMHEAKRKFVVLSDEPLDFGASDAAPSPAEQLLGAVAGCITATTNAFASLNRIKLTNLKVVIEGDLNLQGMFALREDVPIGFNNMKVNAAISGDAPTSKLKEMAEAGFRFSPIRNTVSQQTTVELQVHSKSNGAE